MSMVHVGYTTLYGENEVGAVWTTRAEAVEARGDYTSAPIVRVFIEPDPEADIPELEAVEGLFAGIDSPRSPHD